MVVFCDQPQMQEFCENLSLLYMRIACYHCCVSES